MSLTTLPCLFSKLRLGGLACVVAVGLMLTACSPSHNWRQVRHESVPGRLLLPCKPETAVREVPLLGPGQPAVELSMLSCDVGDQTFAWGAVRLPDGATTAAAMEAWRRAGWISLQQTVPADQLAPAGWQRTVAQVPGGGGAERWMGVGRNHRGDTINVHVQWAHAQGWLHQVALYGGAPTPDTVSTLFESLDLR